ncbi:MAG: hypothetical protein HKO76_02805 [Acidimicrobiia bacterium]|nr:hypothetical protein [Acidimicrobiia bacterium]
MQGYPAHKLGYQNSSPLEAAVIGLAGETGANNTVTYLNANQFQFSAGAPSYTFGGPPTTSPLKLGFKKGDQIFLSGTTGGPGPDEGKWFTFTDPDTLTVLETVSSTAEDYTFIAVRRVHNGVLTETGRQWLTSLCAWSSIGDPDVAVTGDRIRWLGLGDGSFPMIPLVLGLASPIEYQTGLYLSEPSSATEFPTAQSAKISRLYSSGEVSISGPALVSEMGLFVDQNPPQNLDPAVGTHPPVLYKSFDGLVKSSDFSLLVEWILKY